MSHEHITYEPIGVVHSEFTDPADVPKHTRRTVDMTGTVEVFEEYTEGLADIDGFSHVMVISHLHEVAEPVLRADPPFAENREPGIFATRGPRRPNPIGVSLVSLLQQTGGVLEVDDLDLIDGTPVLDIKPFAPKAGEFEGLEGGWIEAETDQSFERFRSG